MVCLFITGYLFIWFWDRLLLYIAQPGLDPPLRSRLSLLWSSYCSLRITDIVGICYHAKQQTIDVSKELWPCTAFGDSWRRSGTAASFPRLWAGPVDLKISLALSSHPSLRGHPTLSEEPSQELFRVSWANWHPPEIPEHCNFCALDPDEQLPAEQDHLPQRKSGRRERWWVCSWLSNQLSVFAPVGGIPRLSWETPSCFFFLKEIPLIFKTG